MQVTAHRSLCVCVPACACRLRHTPLTIRDNGSETHISVCICPLSHYLTISLPLSLSLSHCLNVLNALNALFIAALNCTLATLQSLARQNTRCCTRRATTRLRSLQCLWSHLQALSALSTTQRQWCDEVTARPLHAVRCGESLSDTSMLLIVTILAATDTVMTLL